MSKGEMTRPDMNNKHSKIKLIVDIVVDLC